MTLLLGPANPELEIINPIGYWCYDEVVELAVKRLNGLHQEGKTEFGMLCWPFKLNGAWAAVIGPDLRTKARSKVKRPLEIIRPRAIEEWIEEIIKLEVLAMDYDTDKETLDSVMAEGGLNALKWALGLVEGSVSEFLFAEDQERIKKWEK